MNKNQSNSNQAIRTVSIWGLIVNIGLCVAKVITGILAQSQALVADGIHSISDLLTDAAILIGLRFWSAPPDDRHPHGHGRIETLVTLLIGACLASVGIGLGWKAIFSLQSEHNAIYPGWAAFVVAVASILVKEILFHYTKRTAKAARCSALMANAYHHRSDALSSLPVAVSVLGTQINPELLFLDQIATILVSVFILKSAWDISGPAFSQLIDAAASEKDVQRIKEIAMSIDQVKDVHAIRTRYIGSGIQVDLHVKVDPLLTVFDGHQIATNVENSLCINGPSVIDTVVHLEPFKSPNG